MTARGRGDPVSPGKPTQASRKVPACPICGKPVALESRPFCSRRCADIDLGRWLGGRYAVPGDAGRDMALFRSPTKTIDRFQRAALDRAETISYKPRPCEEGRAVSLLRDAGASPDCRKGPR